MTQNYPNWQLIVIDDQSEDDTRAIALETAGGNPRVVVISGVPLPPGWSGKCWAIQQMLEVAEGDWFFFTDADTRHDPGSISASMHEVLASGGDLLTVGPYLECKSFWEKIVQPNLLVAAYSAFLLRRLEDPKKGGILAYGAYLLVRRSTYELAGGHEAVRDSLAEDMMLFARVKATGGKTRCALGPALYRVRMYTRLAEIWEGYTKAYFAGTGGNWGLSIVAVMVWILASGGSWLALPIFAWRVAVGSPGGLTDHLCLMLAAGAVALQFGISQHFARSFCGLSRWWGLGHPLGFCVMAGIMANSAAIGLFRLGPSWKARSYPGMATSRTLGNLPRNFL